MGWDRIWYSGAGILLRGLGFLRDMSGFPSEGYTGLLLGSLVPLDFPSEDMLDCS